MAISISVHTKDIRRFGDLHRDWLDGWREQLQIIGESMADVAIQQLGDMTPRRSGRASRAWQREVKGIGASGAEGTLQEIYNEAEHYRYLTEGTGIFGPKRHLIVPTTYKAMGFITDGRKIYARFTRGQRPQNIVEHLSEDALVRIAEDHAERYIQNYPK